MITLIENHVPDGGKKVNKVECEHIYGRDHRYNVPIICGEDKYDLLAIPPFSETLEDIKKDMEFYNFCHKCGERLK